MLLFFTRSCKLQIKPFPERQILDFSKLKKFADNFPFDENVRKFSKGTEKTTGKGENLSFKKIRYNNLDCG